MKSRLNIGPANTRPDDDPERPMLYEAVRPDNDKADEKPREKSGRRPENSADE